jgi:hypothetical protein
MSEVEGPNSLVQLPEHFEDVVDIVVNESREKAENCAEAMESENKDDL